MFRKSYVAVVIAGLAVYVLVAHALSFNLVTLPLPGYHPLAHRLGEIMILWTLVWLVWGWYLFFFGGGHDRRIRALGVALVPLVIGIVLGAHMLWWRCQQASPGPHDGVLALLPVASGFLETAKGAIAALTLKLHCEVWRKYPWRASRSDSDHRAEHS